MESLSAKTRDLEGRLGLLFKKSNNHIFVVLQAGFLEKLRDLKSEVTMIAN